MTIRLGGGQGFYGDGHDPVGDLLDAGVDYLVCEALAELTLAILQKDRQRDEALGWTRDLPLYVHQALPWLLDRRTRLITNAGGINPVAAGRAVVGALRGAGAGGLKVATVVGDDVRGPAPPSSGCPSDALFANAYLGARPIVDALDAGADIVITGRVADASLFLAPLVHEHGWTLGRLGPAGRGRGGRPPARVQRAGHRRQLVGPVVGQRRSDADRVPDRRGRGRRLGGHHQAGRARAVGSRSTRSASSSSTRSTTRAAYLNPDVTADFTSLAARRPRR